MQVQPTYNARVLHNIPCTRSLKRAGGKSAERGGAEYVVKQTIVLINCDIQHN